jgi:hypothetical protein
MQYVVCLGMSSHLRRTSHYMYQNCNKVFVSALFMFCMLEKKFVYKLKLQLYHFIFLVCFKLQTELCSTAVTSTFPPPPIFSPFFPIWHLSLLVHGLKYGLSYRCVVGMDQYSVCQQLIMLLVILCGVLFMWLHWRCVHAPVLNLFQAQHWTNLRVKLWI